MADDQEIRRINWTEVFSFTQIFKSFRMAMHFSKLLLALAAIVLIFLIGTGMDTVWRWGGQYVAPGEIAIHFATTPAAFDEARAKFDQDRPVKAFQLLTDTRGERASLSKFQDEYVLAQRNSYLRDAFTEKLRKLPADAGAKGVPSTDDAKKDWKELLSMAQADLDGEVARIETVLADLQDAASKKVDDDKTLKDDQKSQIKQDLKRAVAKLQAGIYGTRLKFRRDKEAITGQAIFKAFRQYELSCLSNALTAVEYGNFTGGLERYRTLSAGGVPDAADQVFPPPMPTSARPLADTTGFVYWVLLAIQGFGWLLSEHYIYGVIFLMLLLAVWAIFGGAIHRIAALHAAREEKMSAMQALRFSIDKFGSFLLAPLMPMLGVLLLGLIIMAGGAIASGAGVHIITAVFFGLAIILGIGIAFLLVGWFFGGSLMYPTIAVEGSDAFDAMSRSFAYVLNRPWRALLYGLTAVVYGTITYLFVRFFAYVALLSAHTFLKAGCFSGGDTLGPGTDRIDVLWGQPTFDTLMGTFPWDAMSGWESVSAGIIAIFVFLVAATVTAYFLSYFSSASTVIYLLLRRQVDATDTDDVYVDEAEEDFSVANGGTKAEPAPTAAPATSPAPAAASTAVAEPTPPAAPAAPAETKAPESPAAPTPPTEPPPSPTAGPIT